MQVITTPSRLLRSRGENSWREWRGRTRMFSEYVWLTFYWWPVKHHLLCGYFSSSLDRWLCSVVASYFLYELTIYHSLKSWFGHLYCSSFMLKSLNRKWNAPLMFDTIQNIPLLFNVMCRKIGSKTEKHWGCRQFMPTNAPSLSSRVNLLMLLLIISCCFDVDDDYNQKPHKHKGRARSLATI